MIEVIEGEVISTNAIEMKKIEHEIIDLFSQCKNQKEYSEIIIQHQFDYPKSILVRCFKLHKNKHVGKLLGAINNGWEWVGN